MSQDILPVSSPSVDRGELPSLMEPMRIGNSFRYKSVLMDLVVELATQAAELKASLPPAVSLSLAKLVRSMNCYYSNLIEGHHTHPIDIERALKSDFSENPKKRDLQLEAKAHIHVQEWIDSGGLHKRAFTQEGIGEIHRRFCENLPDSLLAVEDLEAKSKVKISPGEIRDLDVRVGQHIAISPGAISRFLVRFEQVYQGELGKSESLINLAAAHHRLLWIHPFLDGNGRVARLMSHAALFEHLQTGGLWSVSRGLAREESVYKRHLALCDQSRRNDLDGRGNLSEEALAAFSQFFLEICLDQVQFMRKLIQPERLSARVLSWAEREAHLGRLPSKAELILKAILFRGELPRAELSLITGAGERQARRIVAKLLEIGIVASKSQKSPLHLEFPAALAGDLMPGLFPDI